MPRKLHKVRYYDGKAPLPNLEVFGRHEIMCPTCCNYNNISPTWLDKCEVLDQSNIIIIKKWRIISCMFYEKGEYLLPTPDAPKRKYTKRFVFVVVDRHDNGFPELAIREKPRNNMKPSMKKIHLGGCFTDSTIDETKKLKRGRPRKYYSKSDQKR